MKKPSSPSHPTPKLLRTTIKRAAEVLRFQKDIHAKLAHSAGGRTYVAIGPFAWAIDTDPVRTVKLVRRKIPSHVPLPSRKIMLYDAPAGTMVDAFNGALKTPAGACVRLVAELNR